MAWIPASRGVLAGVLLLCVLTPCAAHETGEVLQIEIAPGANPWTHLLVREIPGDATRVEATGAEEYRSPPWMWEGISFFMAIDNWPLWDGYVADFNPWFGFSSDERGDLFCVRTDRTGSNGCTQTIVPGLQVATSGRQADNDRVIEAAIPWEDVAASAPQERLRGGAFPTIGAGTRIGSEPLLLDDGYRGQRFISGHRTARPTGRDPHSQDILLVE